MAEFPGPESRLLYAVTPDSDGPAAAWRHADAVARRNARELATRLAAGGARLVLHDEAGYPARLNDLPDAPRALFVRGRWPIDDVAVAIVGSRAATRYGMDLARALAGDLARLGITIVSGLARGIDAAAHRGALEAEGASVAFLPGGLDAVTPRHHRELADALCERGALVSERATGEPFGKGAFLQRNRLIAALATVTVVVEAAEKSGALSTAAAARRLGRPLLAVPGDVDRPTSRGVNGLLRAGAAWCESAADVVAAVAAARPGHQTNSLEGRLLAALDATPRAVESLAGAAALPLEDTLAVLLRLEWAGVAASCPGQRWRRA